MASQGAIWGFPTLRFLRFAVAKTTKAVRSKITDAAKPFQGQAQAIPVRSGYTGRQPIHPAALLKQQKRGLRLFSSVTGYNFNNLVRRYISSGRTGPSRFDRSKLPSSNTSRRVAQFSGRAPFANTLRPNLTGGAMPRTAGGYSIGGGARYFSHTPAAPAQVVQNVSQAMRGFLLSGKKLRYDGVNTRGDRRYRAVTSLEDEAMNRMAAVPGFTPGSFIDFQMSPIITALSPLAAAVVRASNDSILRSGALVEPTVLDTEGFLEVLSVDLRRARKHLKAVMADLKRLKALGALPVSLEAGSKLRVRFPGVDAISVERLCDDIGIERGIIGQDSDFDAATGTTVALKFPFAPESERAISSPGGSARSLTGYDLDDVESLLEDDSFVREAFACDLVDSPWVSEPEGYESMSPPMQPEERPSDEFERYDEIYRFLAECDRGRGRLG
ncbi:casein kinase II beta 2 subunit [Pochonia chlamydosporia 170]|uniref:Casein kinase II beta 2 subunit n=1 Tax=Pochonia chlamydosporia 170 TaxID=1380566 RepID=A0A179G4A9_METCM|nr:casein kinase II beta 2 subunit [Pochonia chlamydosporia 170]OAQ72318.1 casein kinase II beta 2 subunit [Pochonia chlamydosporia 170]